MKIKSDFITNSSSTCYILKLDTDEMVDELFDFLRRVYIIEDYETFEDVEDLKEFTNGKPLDWASKPFPPKFLNLTEKEYNLIKDILNENKFPVYTVLDNLGAIYDKKWKKHIIYEEEY